MTTVLVTGVAGFIGYHTAERLLSDGEHVIGVDVVNDYYDVSLKEARLARLEGKRDYHFLRLDIADGAALDEVFRGWRPERVIHLAAQAGVRYSLSNPQAYVDSNVTGFLSILEACRHHGVEHLLFASSSSVYGANTAMPFSEHRGVDHPVSMYAATKRANELMAHSYSDLFGLAVTGLRLFTVYGPWGRPDMALFLFTRAILEGRPIDVFNEGNMSRDFTYVDDVVEGVVRLTQRVPTADPHWSGEAPDPAGSRAPYRIYNIGNSSPVKLMDMIEALENELGKRAEKNLLPLQPGDVPATYANVEDLMRDIGYRPDTSIQEGIHHFVTWYRKYYGC